MAGVRRTSDLGTQGIANVKDGSITGEDIAASSNVQGPFGILGGPFSEDALLVSGGYGDSIRSLGPVTIESTLRVNTTSASGIRFGSGTAPARIWSSAGDNFNVRTHTNTPNPNFSLGVENGSGSDSHVPIKWENNTLYLRGSGTTNRGIEINSSHYVRMGWQPTFVASGGTATQGPGMYKVVFGTVHYDDGGGYNSTTGRFTAPAGASGWYFFSCQARLDGAGGAYIRGSIAKNGTTMYNAPNLHSINGNYHSTNYHSITVAGVMFLLAGDYVEYWTGAEGATSNVQAESTFTGRYLG